jgi:hypothetical protein
MSTRFTIDGSDHLEQHLADTCSLVRAGVQRIIPAAKLEGIALAGGYGRGEGGVLREKGRDMPYNDLEFFVFIRGSTFLNDRRFKASLHTLGESLSPAAGLEVEFKILSIARLRHSAVNMFYYDLVMGHRWLFGDDGLLADCEHHRDASCIPLHEATRLLFNRCSGLLFASERLARHDFSTDDADFVGRNLAKAQLALGDVMLTMNGSYHWSCQERHRRLQSLADVSPLLLTHHAAGVSFKLHPRRTTQSRALLLQEHTEISLLAREIFLRLESRRLKISLSKASDYILTRANKCPEVPLWKNVLIHLRTRGLPPGLTRYPREHLLNEMVRLLWTEKSTQPQAVSQYATLWSCYN